MMKVLTRRILAEKVTQRYCRSFSKSCPQYDSINFAKELKKNMINNKESPPILVNYGNGYFQMLTNSFLYHHARGGGGGGGGDTPRPVSLQLPKDFIVCGPCHGLFCLYTVEGEVVLWNPATGDMKKLRVANCSYDCEIKLFRNVGFGFDSKVKDYKIVRWVGCPRIGGRFDEKITDHIEIYSLKNSEQYIGNMNPVAKKYARNLPLLSPASCTTHGACYWSPGYEDKKTIRLLSFNFAEQQLYIHSLPDSTSPDRNHRSFSTSTTDTFTFSGCAAVVRDYSYQCEIWVGRPENDDDGVINWVAEIGFDHDDPGPCKPLCFYKNDKLILLDSRYQLLLYDLVLKEMHESNVFLRAAEYQTTQNIVKPTIQVLNFPQVLVPNPW